ncbi:MAG: YabP/YqfC family sporulation protein [Candidatus Heteroscillospira sp.]|jgi:sporulation protein YqfC
MGKGLESAAAFFDLPAETLPNVPKLTVTGGSSVVVENHRRIQVFSQELIEIDCGRQLLRLRGSAFELEKMTPGELHIRGKLLMAELD